MSKRTFLDGCVFSTAGALGRSTLDITKAVKDHGGTVSYLITKKTTHLLTTEAEVASLSSKIKSAQSYGAQIVREAFVWDCISAQQLLDVTAYLIPVGLDVSNLSLVPHTSYATVAKSETKEKENKADNFVPKVTTLSTSYTKPFYAIDIQPSSSFSFGATKLSSTANIDPKVQEFVEYIYSEATSAFTTNFDAKFTSKGIETPLGVLSSFQIDKGERVLREINQILKTSEEEVCSNPKLETLSSQFYTTIPHNIGKTQDQVLKHVIRTLPHLQAKQEQLQLMRDILAANAAGTFQKTELEVKYKALKCDIQHLNKGTTEYNDIEKQVARDQEGNIEIVSIFKVKRANEHERFSGSISNHKTLFHGTSIANAVGVLSRGILPPKTVVGVGGKRTDFGWLGSGMYYAPNPNSSVKFTTPGAKGTRILLVATVALGTVKEYTHITSNLERPPMGFHSAHGKPGVGSEFTEDEYAVYKPEQQKLEYVVEFRLHNDVKPSLPAIQAKSPKKAPAYAAHPHPASTTSTFSTTHTTPQKPSHSLTQITATTPLTPTDAEIKSKEDHYRNLFVNSRNHADLRNPHLLLVDLSNTSKFTYSTSPPEYPLILQNANIKREGCAVVSPSEFRENFDKFTENQFRGMNWDNVFVAGGCVLASMLKPDALGNGYKSSDVDMFFYGLTEQQANQKLKDIYALVKQNTQSPCEVIRTKHAVTMINQFPYRHIQIVLRLYKSPAEVLMGFDIDACAVGYDGKNAYALERACRAITRGYNLVDMSRRSLTYESRLYKYSKRGFAVAIPGFDRNKVNPEIFSKSLKDVKGLAQLLLFEFNAFKNSATRNPFKSNKAASQIRHPDTFTEDRLQEFETLRANRELPDSDYSSVYIPWGPQWFAKQILNVLNYQDKAQFFANKNNIRHKHIFVSGVEGVLEGKSFWCKKCKDQIGRSVTADENSGEDYVTGPLKWLQDNPGRQLLTGSFHPVSDDEWELLAYRPQQDGLFDLLSAIFTNNTSQIERSASAQLGDLSGARMHPLLFASLLGNAEGVEALLRAGARQNEIQDNIGLRPIHYAAASGSSDVLRALVRNDSRAAEDANNTNKLTPLHLALYYGHKGAAEFLIEKLGHSRAAAVDSRNRSNIFYAALGGDVECCKLVLHSGQDAYLLQQADANGVTPITAAYANGHQGVLKYFLSVTPSHIDTNAPSPDPQLVPPPYSDQLPALSAVASGSVPTPNGDVDESDSLGVHPLHVAATLPSNYAHVIDTLVKHLRPKFNCTDIIGQTPAHYAVLYGNTAALALLKGANLTATNTIGHTPAYYAKILLGTFSGFRNEYIEGLPTPAYRRKLQEISQILSAHTLALSPYPLPPLLPSQYLSVPSPFAQTVRPQASTLVPVSLPRANLFNFGHAAPTAITGKFADDTSKFGTASMFGKSTAKASIFGKKIKKVADDSEEEEAEFTDEEEKKPKAKPKPAFGKAKKWDASDEEESGEEEEDSPKKKTAPKKMSTFSFGGFGAQKQPAQPSFGFGAQPAQPSSAFGAQPAQSLFGGFGTQAQQPAQSLFGNFGAQPAQSNAAQDEAVRLLQQQVQQQAHELAQLKLQLQQQEIAQRQQKQQQTFSFPSQPAQGQAQAQDLPSVTARLLVLLSLLNKGRNLAMDSKNALKDLVLQGHPLLVAALECYEVDADLDEFADTAERLLATLRR